MMTTTAHVNANNSINITDNNNNNNNNNININRTKTQGKSRTRAQTTFSYFCCHLERAPIVLCAFSPLPLLSVVSLPPTKL